VIPPDQEIYEVEQRIAARRSQVKELGRRTGARAMQALASPAALLGAAALGFFVAGGFARRDREPPHPERRKSDHLKAAKATGIAGMVLPAVMWFVRAQWGSPVRAAQAVLEKIQRRKDRASSKSDTRRVARP
jgi:hypothetical protein